MILHNWNGSTLTLSYDGEMSEIVFPEVTNCPPVFSESKRYIAVGAVKNVYIYDVENKAMASHPVKSKEKVREPRFDTHDRLYFADKNSVIRWDFNARKSECLISLPRAFHGPEALGISPDEKYVSFCKYRSDSYYLYLLNTETGECKDLKFSVYNYLWLDETHIAWTKSGGIKILDTETCKSKTVVNDYKSILKKCGNDDKKYLEPFAVSQNPGTNMDLYGVRDGRLIFWLWVYQFSGDGPEMHHKGLWSVNTDGSDPRSIYNIPQEIFSGLFVHFLEDGNFYADKKDTAYVFDGVSKKEFPRTWRPIVYFGQASR